MHQFIKVYPVSRITGEGTAEFSRAWGPGFKQEGAGGGRRIYTIDEFISPLATTAIRNENA